MPRRPTHWWAIWSRYLPLSRSPSRTREPSSKPQRAVWSISRNPNRPSSIRSISPGWRTRWVPRPRRQKGRSACSTPIAPGVTPPVTALAFPTPRRRAPGGFGPALWDGRPTVQFGDANEDPAQDLLVQFLIRGSEAETPYGLNGFGTGRMPAFGASLSMEDIELLARYLRGGNMDGKEATVVLP